MSCDLPREVSEYLALVESGPHRVAKEQAALAKYIRRCFEEEDLIFDAERCRRYCGMAKYFPFKELLPWEKFLTALLGAELFLISTGKTVPSW